MGEDAYELYMVQGMPWYDDNTYNVAHQLVVVSEVDAESVSDCYGYENLDAFKQEYGDDWADVLAEYEFELTACSGENLLYKGSMSYDQAVSAIKLMSGFER